ncbi:hypothetical protein [Emticicia sp. BO119]|uniref:hypothetical protein n=1 Tax=Emticicia sp. BO119 TaxID=2757768 RepID=UPI0015F097C7|nr:hypothetical protein [Emticicia sp. BO119]MBA4850550.1 hypothetical protein [Emticicia sp. BO119]
MVVIFVVTIVLIACLAIVLPALKNKKLSNNYFQNEITFNKIPEPKTALRLIEYGVAFMVIGGLFVVFTLFLYIDIPFSKNRDSLNVYKEATDAGLGNKKRDFLLSSVVLLISGNIMLLIGNSLFLNTESVPQRQITKKEEAINDLLEEDIVLDQEILV